MPVLPAAVAGALVLAALIGWLVQRERRLARRRAELLTSLGFRPVEQPDPGHAAALLALYRRGRNRDRRLDLLRVFHRDGAAGHHYVFDVYAWAGKRSGLAAAGAVGLVRAGAGFPSFELYSAASVANRGDWAGLLRKLVEDAPRVAAALAAV